MTDEVRSAHPFAYTCPICGGAMHNGEGENGPWFQCAIGHVFSATDMDTRTTDMVDAALATALRVLDERAALCSQFSAAAARTDYQERHAYWRELQQEVEMKAKVVAGLIDRGWPDRSGE